jgi:hypothetical protein
MTMARLLPSFNRPETVRYKFLSRRDWESALTCENGDEPNSSALLVAAILFSTVTIQVQGKTKWITFKTSKN